MQLKREIPTQNLIGVLSGIILPILAAKWAGLPTEYGIVTGIGTGIIGTILSVIATTASKVRQALDILNDAFMPPEEKVKKTLVIVQSLMNDYNIAWEAISKAFKKKESKKGE